MSESSPGQSARLMLERQLEALGSLYNAGVRSPNFREWRQATLTCIQRIWPAEPARSERFRRIPFSAPMGRPAEREVREYYERGCGEAGSLLKDYIAEVATVGLPNPGAATAQVAAPPVAGRNDDDFPTVDLPESGAGSPAGGAASAAVPPKLRLKDLLGFSEVPPAAPVQNDAPASAGAPPLPPPPAPAPAAAAPAPVASPFPGASAVEQAMAELESHGFFAPPIPRDAAASGPAPPPAEPIAPAPAPSVPAPAPRIVVTGTEASASATPPLAIVPGHSVSQGPERAASAAASRAADPDDLDRVADELLRASAALSALPRRSSPDRRSGPREVRSPVPLAIAALALELEALGVPEGHRARTRAVLLDLSRRLDSPNLSWDALREAINFVMEFPVLGRRMVPLLLPYLDRAA